MFLFITVGMPGRERSYHNGRVEMGVCDIVVVEAEELFNTIGSAGSKPDEWPWCEISEVMMLNLHEMSENQWNLKPGPR